MSEQPKKIPCGIGLLAHVDAGKTTLSEALLYTAGARRTLGRVDHGDAFLDTADLERRRGITIYAKQALFSAGELPVTLLDTPGHVDFAPEAERVLPVLDCAVLVISGTDGVQAHTRTLWSLLERYGVPTFLFVNKMDLAGADKEALLKQVQEELSPNCLDFTQNREVIAESAALCDEVLLENYLVSGEVSDGAIRGLVEGRRVFPCCFGSALRLAGVDTLLDLLERYAPQRVYGQAFAARVYKISRDDQGNRLTWLKVTGGRMAVRQNICYVNQKGEQLQEKITRLRLYSGEKFETPESLGPGNCCAVQGLTGTWAGQGLGADPGAPEAALEPVMSYRVVLGDGTDPQLFLPKLRQLEEEDPQLCITWDDRLKQIQASIMGRVQMEVLQNQVKDRFGVDITLDAGRIHYKETIENTVEGVGHYEPLRHYAEVHLLLEPLPRGSGIQLQTKCPGEVLEESYQNLVLTHLQEKVYRGVVLGAPVTDLRITLVSGRAHLKHTEGGDFRQATYRAVRQGLMQAKSVILEPWYAFTLTVPTAQIGRAITDVRAMSGQFQSPEQEGEMSVLRGRAPVSEMLDYAAQLSAYTRGLGRLQTQLWGYDVCHNSDAVRAQIGYDPDSDLDDPAGSVFCAHGAGFYVPWDQVQEHMHLESSLKPEPAPQVITRNLRLDDKELERIMEREFGPVKRPLYRAPENRPASEKLIIQPPRKKCLIVDGYNIIFAWEDLARQARTDLEAARRQLLDALRSYCGVKPCYLVVVFDGYRVKGSRGSQEKLGDVQVVYTGENETADSYIEALAARIGGNYAVRVVSSDALVQLSSFRSGVLRMSARELREEVELARKEMKNILGNRFQSDE